jgi:hypothetical protein
MKSPFPALFVAALLLPSLALASPPTPAGDPRPSEVRLTPAEIEKVLATAARKREANIPPTAETPIVPHGEIGFEIGSGGYRSAFGTIGVPLSDDGFASFSFGTTTGDRRFYRPR